MSDTPVKDATALAAALHVAWERGLAVMLSPLLDGQHRWHGEVAVYIYEPTDTPPTFSREWKGDWRGDPAANIVALMETISRHAPEG